MLAFRKTDGNRPSWSVSHSIDPFERIRSDLSSLFFPLFSMRWGLVLSGGAALSIANVGILEVLEREGLRPDYIAGSSMGALIGGLWALGYPAKTLKKICRSLTLTNIMKVERIPWWGGLHQGLMRQTVTDHIATLVGKKTIGDCRIPFLCVAGKVRRPLQWLRLFTNGCARQFFSYVKTHVFPPGARLMDALLATTALPILFHPFEIGKDSFVDLLSFGAIPTLPLREKFSPDIVIATDTTPRWTGLMRFFPSGLRCLIEDGIRSIERSKSLSTLVITPALQGGALRFDRTEHYLAAGRKAAEDMLPAIREALKERG